MLERNAATVTAHIDGLCASAATIVACHADKVVARRTAATWSIRSAWAFAIT
jgi:ClpP class serine protease